MSLARTYARAFHETASKEPQEISQLRAFSNLVDSNSVLESCLTSPMTSVQEKTAVVDGIQKKMAFSPLVLRFVGLLIRKNRLIHLKAILAALEEVRIESEGGTLGQIVCADEIGDKEVADLASAFRAVLGKKVDFQTSTDPSLLAGLKVTVEGITYDGSLKGQLERVRRAVTGAAGAGSSG